MTKPSDLDTKPWYRVLSSVRRKCKAERRLRVEQLRNRNSANKDRLPPIMDMDSRWLFSYCGALERSAPPKSGPRSKYDNHRYDDDFAGKWFWMPPLHIALFRRDKSVVESLLRQGANPNLRDRYGQTPLHVISWCLDDDEEFAKKFFEIVDETVDVETGQRSVVRVNVAENNGGTALHCAAFCGHSRVAKLLLSKGADPNVANDAGFTPLNWICRHHDYAAAKRFFEIADETGTRPLRVDMADNWGWTPLHYAMLRKDLDKAKLLLSRGADANSLNRLRETPLHVLCKYLSADEAHVVERFFEIVGATRQKVRLDVVDRWCTFTPLDWALFCGHDQVAKVLLSRGASANLAAEFGLPPTVAMAKTNESCRSTSKRAVGGGDSEGKYFDIYLMFLSIVCAVLCYLPNIF
ncbi:hypothetical protein TKK_0008251 [Trichogramma kaykai]|uniref:Ankyrin repeat protein n=1 Tax=Trichogramma kaykai TaxID=54128 RepID=A0ABD2X4D2_9HYME